MNKAMIFAAGRGTRLQPLTDNIPKALVKVNGKPLLGSLIERLKLFGISEIIINVHHFPEQIMDYLKQNNNFNIRIEISDESGKLLDTGGGLKKASWFFNDNEPFLVHNADIITGIDFHDMLKTHKENNALATLAVRNRQTTRYLLFDENMKLTGWENTSTGEKIIKRQGQILNRSAFSGVQILNPQILNLMPDKEVFSLIELYLELCGKEAIKAYNHTDTLWFDIGTKEKLRAAEEYLQRTNF